MPKYKERQVDGVAWNRAKQIICNNPYNGIPSIHYHEESMTSFSDGSVISNNTPGTQINQLFTPDLAEEEFQLVNPMTDELVPDQFATYQTLFVLLYSLYFHLAKKRDQGPKPYDSWIWDDNIKEWVAPIAKPDTENTYIWDEELTNWILV